MTSLIFDIDDTLIQTFDFEGTFYIKAVKHVLGNITINDNWGHYKNVTDVGILKQLMDENKIQDKSLIQKVRNKFGELIQSYLENGGQCSPIKGAVEWLQKIRLEKKNQIGIATGGWGHTAKLKLQHAGFDIQGLVLCSCDDSEERIEIMKKCLDQLGGLNSNVVYFGDGDWDQKACDELRWRFVGVGLNLKGKCDFWIYDFSDQSVVDKLLLK